jgi:hypothetical protein
LNDSGSAIDIGPVRSCRICLSTTVVRKTVVRRVKAPSGVMAVREHVSSCPVHGKLLRPEPITPRRSSHTFDLIVRIGMLRYVQHKQISEIRDELKNLQLPARTVSWLCRLFLKYILAVHLDSAPAIRSLLSSNGGYVLMLDGTGQNGPMVMQMRDGWSGIHLLSCSVRSENEGEIVPRLLLLKNMFGTPVACVRDMGSGVTKSLKMAFPDTYSILCHFHFLRAEGWKLFEPVYPSFRSRIDRMGIKRRLRHLMRAIERGIYGGRDASLAMKLCRYIFDYKKDAHGLSYPFSLPILDFYTRCENVRKGLAIRVDVSGRRRGKPLTRLFVLLEMFYASLGASAHYQAVLLTRRRRWFNRIRNALRYRNGPIPLNSKHNLSEMDLERGRIKLDWLISIIDRGSHSSGEKELRRTLLSVKRDLTERRDELFAPNALVTVKGKSVVKPVTRTISSEESEFRKLRRHDRRIKGNSHVDSEVQEEGAAMLILENLKNKEYVKAVYGSISKLPERFAMVSKDSLRMAEELQHPLEK